VEKEHLNSNDEKNEKYEFFSKFIEEITQEIVIKSKIIKLLNLF
jgi:hypothetical protein